MNNAVLSMSVSGGENNHPCFLEHPPLCKEMNTLGNLAMREEKESQEETKVVRSLERSCAMDLATSWTHINRFKNEETAIGIRTELNKRSLFMAKASKKSMVQSLERKCCVMVVDLAVTRVLTETNCYSCRNAGPNTSLPEYYAKNDPYYQNDRRPAAPLRTLVSSISVCNHEDGGLPSIASNSRTSNGCFTRPPSRTLNSSSFHLRSSPCHRNTIVSSMLALEELGIVDVSTSPKS